MQKTGFLCGPSKRIVNGRESRDYVPAIRQGECVCVWVSTPCWVLLYVANPEVYTGNWYRLPKPQFPVSISCVYRLPASDSPEMHVDRAGLLAQAFFILDGTQLFLRTTNCFPNYSLISMAVTHVLGRNV